MWKQKSNYNKLSKKKQNLLKLLPNWFWSKDDKYKEILKKYNSFKNKQNKLPSKNSKDKEERKLAYWKINQIRNS